MNKFAILTDTAADLTYEIAEEYDIALVSYQLQLDDRHLIDQVDITKREFYETMDQYKVLSTGIPSIQTVLNKLEDLKEAGYQQVLVICNSEKITGMRQLYEVVKSDHSDLDIHIFDSGLIASATGLQAIYASQLRAEGKHLQEIIQELNRIKDQSKIFALFRTLTYLVKGGRFNRYKGAFGNLLNINPLLSAVDGEVGVIDKVRGTKKSLQALIKVARQEIGDSKDYMLAIFSGNNDQEVEEIKAQLGQELANARKFIEIELTPVLGCHAGPKSIGISVVRLDS